MTRISKAEALRRARATRAELLMLISILEEPGQPGENAAQRASLIFEQSRNLESCVHRLVRR